MVKECFELPAMPFSAGIWLRRDVVGRRACTAMRRVMGAGMPILGVTNVSEVGPTAAATPSWAPSRAAPSAA